MSRRPTLLAALAIVAIGGVLAAQTDPKQLSRDAEARIKELQKEADAAAKESSTLLNELRRLEVDRQIRAQEVKKAEAELASVEQQMTQSAARIAALEAERVAETPWVREHLIALYKRGRSGYVQMLMSADDLKSAGRVTRGVAAIAQNDRMRLQNHLAVVRQQREALAQLESQRGQLDAARGAAVNARAALERAVAAHTQRLAELDRRRDVAARFMGELQLAQDELQRSLTSLPGTTAILPIGPFRGRLEWPVEGRLLSRFGRSTADRFGSTVARNGVEIATVEGAPVRAVHDGTVAYAAPFRGFGTLVIVDHGSNAFSLYGHLSQVAVTNGSRVGRNEEIGRAGRTPDGVPAAYFELRIDGRPVDPVQWLRSQR
jgi:septal ring factor EnvC (AmiA/AmiB activator)